MTYNKKTIEIDIDRIKLETDKAILVIIDDEEIWLPKSQITYNENHDPDKPQEIEISEWIAEQKGLI